MGGRWALALCATAGVFGASSRAADPGATPAGVGLAAEVCELGRVDRTRTPSHACMDCHDGSAGASISFSMRSDGLGMSHPVSVDYGAAAARQPSSYVPAGALPPNVPLVNGRVECTSCHDGASSAPKRVAEPTAQLCYACHRL